MPIFGRHRLQKSKCPHTGSPCRALVMTTVDVVEVELQVLNTQIGQSHDTDSKLTVMEMIFSLANTCSLSRYSLFLL